MANNNLNIKATASLDRTKTLTQINADIKAIEGQLRHLKLQAGLDKGKTNAEIQKQISELSKQKRQLNVDLKLRQKDLKKQYRDAVAQLQTNPIDIEVTSTTAQNNIKSLSNEVNRTTNETVKLASKLKEFLNHAGMTITSQTALQYIRKAASEAVEAIQEYDRYATNLSTITGGSRVDSDRIISNLAEKSLEFKIDISDLESAEETLLRTGKSIVETNKLLESTTYLSKLGFEDMNTAASQLITIANAYEYSAGEMAAVTDKFLKLDTQANVTAGGLAEGVAKSAQNAKLAGFNIDQLSASIAALKDTTGNTETQVANSLNMIFSRLQNVKLGKYVIELEDGDTEDITEALNDVEKILNTVNIKLRDSKGEFRDIGELFTELSENWSKFNSVQQSAIANTVAGARQRNTFIALIENWNKVQELTDVSLNSAGTAVQKYESYLNSIEAKTAELNTSMKELWNDLLPNGLMGNLLEAGTTIVQLLDKLQILKTALTGVVVWGAANGLLAATQGLDGIITSLTNMSAAMRLASKGAALTNAEFDTLKTISNGLTDSQLKLLLSVEGLTEEQIKQLILTKGLTEAELQQRLATLGLAQADLGLAQAETTTTTATFSLSGALKTLWATINANPIMTLTMLITGAIVAFDYIQRKEAESRDAAVDSANAYKEQAKSLAELRQNYIDIIDNEMTDSEKTEELNKWKQTLIETYRLEKSVLENINLEREKGLGLLDEEIAKQNRNARNKWFDENEKAINKSQQKMGYSGQDYFQIPDGKDVADSIAKLFDKRKILGYGITEFEFEFGDGIDRLEKLKAIYNEILDIQSRRSLTAAEQTLLDEVKRTKDSTQKTYDKHGQIYETKSEYNAKNLVENSLEMQEVGKDNFEAWKKGLLDKASSHTEREEIKRIIAETFPDYSDYFNNLDTAKKCLWRESSIQNLYQIL